MNHICENVHNCEKHEGVEADAVDILVIGGGVNGLAIAREAQVRGWSSAVVDAEDFGAGTSGASSRMVHGGIRYLENLEFHLVRESLKERERLLYTAPHLVKPFALLIPFYRHNKRHALTLRLGMILYDLLSFDKSTPLHKEFSKKQVEQAYPGLERKDLSGAALYYDAQAANTERLCIEQAIDIFGLGGSVHNHCRVTSLHSTETGVEITLRDTLSGRMITQHAGVVVNAAGPWVDLVLGLSPAVSPRLIGGTKGSHFTVGPFPGAPETGVHFEAASDGRAILILPLPGGNLLVGATDLFFDGDPGAAVMSDAEITYLINEVNQLIPEAHLTTADVLHSVSGVRPLPYTPKARSAAQVSRSHHLVPHPTAKNLFSITGGKLTTHRALGEMVISQLEKLARRPKAQNLIASPRTLVRRATSTRRLKLPGARCVDWPEFERLFLSSTSLPVSTARRLLGLYGVRATKVENLAKSNDEWARPLPGNPDSVSAEVIFAIRDEFALTLTDIVARRLLLSWNNDAGLDSITHVAELASAEFGWSDERTEHELNDYRTWIQLRRPAAYENLFTDPTA
ncbi:glycerol-3-phosphate dehydrogenase/oxidase [Cryobacterium sp. Y57]|uniref:glycerol-3-phosphate dehydrogenase/oxidase n=1 Tax=Cryobacterium sp. Y57 TaxID=2048287 RepID=UPI001304E239|nr:glycerol-3-phosphate dehydrogenase/oxidase [Cryobacterium sp. Y57]